MAERERWGSRMGLILAMSGNAIGLGNFLRFPVQAAQNGGGAFLIPYFIALLFLGIPLMWIEWGIGRYGGAYGHGTCPGMFDRLWKHPMAKYLGVLGVSFPVLIVMYYTYIESWTLAYSFFSLTKKYFGIESLDAMSSFLSGYQGIGDNPHFSGIGMAYVMFLITLAINIFILSKGISRGIEILAKIAMPTLFVFAIILMVRVFTLGTPDPMIPENSINNGLGFMWNSNFELLAQPKVWLAAAGQVFFTLSIGTGAIQTYASYLRERDDILLTGLTTSMTNEFTEIIFGSSIAIPVAVAFFGAAGTQEIAAGGAFNLGFMAMPIIFQKIPLGEFFGFLWFFLLFFAGITSSVALSQPLMAFFQEEFKITRERSAIILGFIFFLAAQPIIFFLQYGYLDEMDFWVGTFGLVVFSLIETIIFFWVFGADEAWEELHKGGQIKLPRVYYYITKYITPVYLIVLLGAWGYKDGIPILLMEGVDDPKEKMVKWGARLFMVAFISFIGYLVHRSWKNKEDMV